MTEISQLKFVQWRPIGVCDTGSGKERKAKMFSKADLATVTAPDVKRGNWRQHPEVIRLIERYASEVAELSALTDGMHSPEVTEINLVGAVLGLNQTPILNQQSSDGKVQFFQVSFRDGKSKRISHSNWKKWLKLLLIATGAILAVVLIYLMIIQLSQLPQRNTKTNEICGSNRQKSVYSEELQTIRKSLIDDLARLPDWSTFKQARAQCIAGNLGVNQQEQRLIQCFLTVRNRVKSIPTVTRPDLSRIESCVRTICSQRRSHLSSACKRL